MKIKDEKLFLFALFVILIFILLGLMISKAGIRGSDQYWYVADTESLITGNGVQTNNILINNIVNDSIVQNKGFIHNVPQVYIAALPALFFGAFNGWLIMNTLFSLLSAFLLFLVLIKFLKMGIAVLISLQFLVVPLTFWQSYQPLAESLQCFLLISILHVYFINHSINRYFIQLALIVILLLCRNNYILIVPVITTLFYSELRSKYRIIYSAIYLVSILILFRIGKIFLPDIWNFSFYDTIVTSKVGELNFSSSLDLVKIYLKNLITFFQIQFVNTDSTIIFYLPYNVFVLGTLIMWFRNKNRVFNYSFFIVTFSILFLLLTTIISQNQARYMMPFYPLVMFSFFYQLNSNSTNNLYESQISKLLVVSIIISLAINFYITESTISEGRDEKSKLIYYSDIYNNIIPENESVIFGTNNTDYIMPGYLLRPRKIFVGNETIYLESQRYSELIDRYDIKWVITKNNHGNAFNFKHYQLELKKICEPYDGNTYWYIYNIRDNFSDTI